MSPTVDCPRRLRATEAFARTVIRRDDERAPDHRLPDEDEARRRGAGISAAGMARPA
jgi:hypothetical protein